MAEWKSGDGGRYPVFITRYSLSPKTAIGIQTSHYLDAFTDWRHLHWLEFGSLVSKDRRSIRFGNFLVGKWPHYAKQLERFPPMRRFGRLVWADDVLIDPVSRGLVAELKNRASALYLAPVDDVDAGRMRHLAELFGRPFVLHLWDCMGVPLLESEHHRWLIQNAHRVFALSKPLIEESMTLRPDVSELLFVREQISIRAKLPEGGPLRVALIGFLPAYRPGLHLLHDALKQMRAAGTPIELHFVGSPRALRRLNEPITKEMAYTGHLRNHVDRDRALANCHVAFLPGPPEPPEENLRSRYSIPSRVLDYMAVGLPVVGAVHPRSATAQMCEEYGIAKYLLCGTAQQIVEAFTELRDAREWRTAHQASLLALEKIDCRGQLERLKAAMASAAASG